MFVASTFTFTMTPPVVSVTRPVRVAVGPARSSSLTRQIAKTISKGSKPGTLWTIVGLPSWRLHESMPLELSLCTNARHFSVDRRGLGQHPGPATTINDSRVTRSHPVAYLCMGYVREFPDGPELQRVGWRQRVPLSESDHGRRCELCPCRLPVLGQSHACFCLHDQ